MFVLRDLDHHSLKGASAPVALFQVLGESETQSRLDVATTTGLTPLVGREQEVGLLLDRWEQVTQGQGQVVLLSGDRASASGSVATCLGTSPRMLTRSLSGSRVACARWRATHPGTSLGALRFGCIVSGVASALRNGRLSTAWGRSMLARRGSRARLRWIAEAGYQRRPYFAELGSIGGRVAQDRRRRQAVVRALEEVSPHRAEHARRVLAKALRSPVAHSRKQNS